MNGLLRYLQLTKPHFNNLPLAHTTDAHSFMKLIDEPIMKVSKCPYYKEDLLYFFYARPAYRLKHLKGASVSLPGYFPVSFIIRQDFAPPPKRIMPFDTGAFRSGLYKSHLHPDMTPDDFDLGNDVANANKIVRRFFKTTKNYFDGHVTAGLKVPPSFLEAAHYYSLISTVSETPFDDRRGTIEFQFSAPIDLLKQDVLAVVLPRPFMRDERIQNFVTKTLKSKALTYTATHANLVQHVGAIFDKTRTFYRQEGFI